MVGPSVVNAVEQAPVRKDLRGSLDRHVVAWVGRFVLAWAFVLEEPHQLSVPWVEQVWSDHIWDRRHASLRQPYDAQGLREGSI